MVARGRSRLDVPLRAARLVTWGALSASLACSSVDPGAIGARPDGTRVAGSGGAGSGVAGSGGAGNSGAGGVGDAALPMVDAAVCYPNPDRESSECPEICPELCNDEDDDCDGRTDEAPASLDCALASATSTCNAGQCEIVACEDGFESCDDDDSNGCEAELATDEQNCGACELDCNALLDNAESTRCVRGSCEVIACEDGFASCDDDATGCETAIHEPESCGGCVGEADHEPCTDLDNVAESSCPAGSCQIDDCENGFANCDGMVDNGCERDTTVLGPCEVRVREITIDPSFVGETLTDFAVLVRLRDDDDLKLARADGGDIFFTTDRGVATGAGALSFEIEAFDQSSGDLIAWVRVPSVSSTEDTTFYLHCADGIDHAEANTPEATWDSDFESVLHFEGMLRDSAATARAITNNGSTADSAGQIGSARAFVPNASISMGVGVLPAERYYTLSAWVKVPVGGGGGADCKYVMDASTTMPPYDGSGLGVQRSTGAICAYLDGEWRNSSTDFVSDDTWSFIAMRYDINASGIAESSVNGQPFETLHAGDTRDANNVSTSPYRVGGWSGGSSYSLSGSIDELRVSSASRSAHWIRAEYENQRTGSTFLSIASP